MLESKLQRNNFLISLLIMHLIGASSIFAGVILNGSGATFPSPLYSDWVTEYEKVSGVRILYEANGSGEGIRQLLERNVDFGATDVFLNEYELSQIDDPVLHIPTCLGAVVITYNLPGDPVLRLTPELVSAIFLGEISSWDDGRIRKVNPHLNLPGMEITPVYRSGSSGTTYILTDYLSKVSDRWRELIGTGRIVRWPSGVGIRGNDGISRMVSRISGSIGYLSFLHAQQNQLPVAVLRNQKGRFIRPTLESVAAAADVQISDSQQLMITDTSVTNGYPIGGFSYLIVYQEQAYDSRTMERARAIAQFLWWAVHDGQQYNEALLYAPLPEIVRKRAAGVIQKMTFKGKSLLGR